VEKQELTRLNLLRPVRQIQSNRRSLVGRVRLATGGAASFESSLERDWLICLDFDPDVQMVVEQPFTLSYVADGVQRRYTPDVLAQFSEQDGLASVIVYEVKPIDELRAQWQTYKRRFRETVAFCRQRDWRFKIVTEKHIRTPYLQNAKFLRKYRNYAAQTMYRDQMLYSLRLLGEATPQSLLALSYRDEEKRMAALTELWRMVAAGELRADLNKPLTMQSPIWAGRRT